MSVSTHTKQESKTHSHVESITHTFNEGASPATGTVNPVTGAGEPNGTITRKFVIGVAFESGWWDGISAINHFWQSVDRNVASGGTTYPGEVYQPNYPMWTDSVGAFGIPVTTNDLWNEAIPNHGNFQTPPDWSATFTRAQTRCTAHTFGDIAGWADDITAYERAWVAAAQPTIMSIFAIETNISAPWDYSEFTTGVSHFSGYRGGELSNWQCNGFMLGVYGGYGVTEFHETGGPLGRGPVYDYNIYGNANGCGSAVYCLAKWSVSVDSPYFYYQVNNENFSHIHVISSGTALAGVMQTPPSLPGYDSTKGSISIYVRLNQSAADYATQIGATLV